MNYVTQQVCQDTVAVRVSGLCVLLQMSRETGNRRSVSAALGKQSTALHDNSGTEIKQMAQMQLF